MIPDDWPIGATFTYNSPYGSTNWIGIVGEANIDTVGHLYSITSTKGGFYNTEQINLETKGEFTERIREQRLGNIGL